MFTGLIQEVGTLAKLTARSKGARATISCKPWDDPLSVGDSIAVQGTCVSVTEVRAGEFDCDILAETLAKTNLSSKRPGEPVNLERGLRSSDRLDGHMVTGHVDGVGTVLAIDRVGADRAFRIGCEPAMLQQIVKKGSVACDGVSLTVTEVDARCFVVHVIPLTWQHTSLSALRAGLTVNIETDIIAKYVQKYEMGDGPDRRSLTLETLRNAGYPV